MTDCYVGEIRLFAGVRIPAGWQICDGRLLSIDEHNGLYGLLGTNYGGDGRATFGIPDLRGRVPVGLSARPAYKLATSGGEEAHALTESELPAHTHDLHVSAAPATSIEPGSGLVPANIQPSPPVNGLYTASKASETMPLEPLSPLSIEVAGNGKVHNNMMPTLAINYIISLNGIFPNRA